MKPIKPIQINNLADLFEEYQIKTALFEDWLAEHITQYCKITHDYYDNSLEIYLGPYWNNIKLDDKIMEVVRDHGFGMCYINYCNSKEEVVYFGKSGISRGDIRLAPNPRWTEAEAQEYISE
jgi:hypothetical protein